MGGNKVRVVGSMCSQDGEDSIHRHITTFEIECEALFTHLMFGGCVVGAEPIQNPEGCCTQPTVNQQRLKEIPPVEKVRADALSHFSANPEKSNLPGVVTFVYNYMRRYFS